MKNPSFSLKINLGLLFTGLLTVFSGLSIQVNYHMGNHGPITTDDHVSGIGYYGWSAIHKLSIVILSLFIILHIYLHWEWYSMVIKKRLVAKNKQVLTLSGVFILVAVTGFTPWIIDLHEGSKIVSKAFIEIHDKLTILLTLYLVLHIIKRRKWFLTAFKKLKIKQNTQQMAI